MDNRHVAYWERQPRNMGASPLWAEPPDRKQSPRPAASLALLLRSAALATAQRFAVLLVLMLPVLAVAHPGGLDFYGCHHDRKGGGYHCHRGPLAGHNFASKVEMLRKEKQRNVEEQQGVTGPSASPTQELRRTADTGQITGRVVGLADGDTITVLDASNRQHKVRLAGIDAPERRQPYSKVSRKQLSELIADKAVTVAYYKRDRYGRLVGNVYLGGLDVGLAQIRAGMAWHFKRYEQEQTPEARHAYREAEARARAARRGLWQDESPVPPWEWRKIRSGD